MKKSRDTFPARRMPVQPLRCSRAHQLLHFIHLEERRSAFRLIFWSFWSHGLQSLTLALFAWQRAGTNGDVRCYSVGIMAGAQLYSRKEARPYAATTPFRRTPRLHRRVPGRHPIAVVATVGIPILILIWILWLYLH
jgi:hypothetical protein